MVRLDQTVRCWASTEHSVPLKQVQRRIRSGEVTVDDVKCIEPRYQLLPGVERVICCGVPVPSGDHMFCLMNKPAGYICQRHPREPTVYDLVPHELRRNDLSACGRLDRDTTGMLLFSTDGGIQSLLLFPTSRVWKTYTAVLTPESLLVPEAEALFEAGLVLDDGLRCAPASLERIESLKVRVHVHEGHFHQVKRMLACVGGIVMALHRDAFGLLTDPQLPVGATRTLTHSEMLLLLDMLPLSRMAEREVSARFSRTSSSTLPARPRCSPDGRESICCTGAELQDQ